MSTATATAHPTSPLARMWRTSMGKKVIAAVTGAILVAYLVLHMVGNLTVFSGNGGGGEAKIDTYSHWLRTFGTPLLPERTVLWAVRVLLIVAIVVHITVVLQLRQRNNHARPAGHKAPRLQRTWSSRTMILTGSLLLFFIVFHILQFTTLTIDVNDLQEGAVYSNLYNAFQSTWVVVLYVLAMGAVAFHLRHGVWSLVQTLGLDTPARNGRVRLAANLLTAVVAGGFVIIPILMWAGAFSAP